MTGYVTLYCRRDTDDGEWAWYQAYVPWQLAQQLADLEEECFWLEKPDNWGTLKPRWHGPAAPIVWHKKPDGSEHYTTEDFPLCEWHIHWNPFVETAILTSPSDTPPPKASS